ncbi:MAG: hypothetical protein COA53_04980 [Rhodobacteraceae bacterium]|nr:MAG: hypothetical protein COA53_04980 [Paracoccaceae bacterium]
MKTILRALIIGMIAAMASQPLFAQVWREGEFRGTVILTVTGNVALPTRQGSSEDVDKFFIFNDITFDKAAQFDVAALQALPQVSVNADFPMGGRVYLFEGPLLKDVLESVGATGEVVTIRALDGYAVDISLTDAYAAGAVVALKRDGIPFAIGDFGPTHIVFPRADRADLADMNDDWWVWSIYHINVE